MKTISYDNVYDAFRDTDVLRSRFLRQQGWVCTSSTFGSRWKWTKTIDGLTYALSSEDAMDMERMLININAEENVFHEQS